MDFAVFKAVLLIMTTGYQQGGVDTLPFRTMAECEALRPIIQDALDKNTQILVLNARTICVELKP